MKSGEMTCEMMVALPGERHAVAAVRGPEYPLPAFAVRPNSDASRFTPVLTLVLWLGCSVIAALGFALPYVRPQAALLPPEPLAVEMLNVELSNEPLTELEPPSVVENALTIPPPPEAVFQPQLPQPVAVALPSAAIAFAVPVEGPVRVVEAAQASYSRPSDEARVAATASMQVQPLTFGHGAGRQPEPAYPLRARREGQEGVVQVRFTVAESGRVAAAEAVQPSPWALLNDSAVRTIRGRWRFPAGEARAYEVAIRFQLRSEHPTLLAN